MDRNTAKNRGFEKVVFDAVDQFHDSAQIKHSKTALTTSIAQLADQRGSEGGLFIAHFWFSRFLRGQVWLQVQVFIPVVAF